MEKGDRCQIYGRSYSGAWVSKGPAVLKRRDPLHPEILAEVADGYGRKFFGPWECWIVKFDCDTIRDPECSRWVKEDNRLPEKR